MINKVILVGRVGKDPEVRHLDNNASVARFSLATSESYKNKNGEKVTNTEWHNIVAWRGQADPHDRFLDFAGILEGAGFQIVALLDHLHSLVITIHPIIIH